MCRTTLRFLLLVSFLSCHQFLTAQSETVRATRIGITSFSNFIQFVESFETSIHVDTLIQEHPGELEVFTPPPPKSNDDTFWASGISDHGFAGAWISAMHHLMSSLHSEIDVVEDSYILDELKEKESLTRSLSHFVFDDQSILTSNTECYDKSRNSSELGDSESVELYRVMMGYACEGMEIQAISHMESATLDGVESTVEWNTGLISRGLREAMISASKTSGLFCELIQSRDDANQITYFANITLSEDARAEQLKRISSFRQTE